MTTIGLIGAGHIGSQIARLAVAHGYKVIGTQPSMLIYMTDRFYDPTDEGRIPHNQPELNYDWELQHK